MTNHIEKHSPVESEPLTSSSSGFVKKYIGAISLITTILIIVIFWGFYQEDILRERDLKLLEIRKLMRELGELDS